MLKDRKLISIIAIVTAVILIVCIGLFLCLHKKNGESGNLVGNNRIVNIEQIDGRTCILGNPERCHGTYIVRDYDADGNEYSAVERNYNFFVDKVILWKMEISFTDINMMKTIFWNGVL